MDESTRMMVVLGVISLLVIVAVYRFVTQRRQLSSGRTMGRFFPQRHGGKLVFENQIIVSACGKWCRLLPTLKSAAAYRIQYSSRYFFEKVALIVGTPYTLTIRNDQNRVVHTETRSLEPFVTLLGSRERTTETMLSENPNSRHQGTVTLLEFMPKVAGRYHISLQIVERIEAEYPGSSSTWELLEVELTAMEEVIPLSKTVNYPHQRVRI